MNTREWNPEFRITPGSREASGVRGDSRGGGSRGGSSRVNPRGRSNARGGGHRGNNNSNRGNYNPHYDYSGGNSDTDYYRSEQDWNPESSGVGRGAPIGQSRRNQGYGQEQGYGDDSRRSDRDDRESRRSGSRDSRNGVSYGASRAHNFNYGGGRRHSRQGRGS